MGRRGHRGDGNRLLEDDPFDSERGEVRGFGILGSVRSQVIRARCIEGDQENRRAALGDSPDGGARILRCTF